MADRRDASSSRRPAAGPFTQAVARELSTHEHLVFACGRYEGIDQRVIEHAATIGTVREISLGDYVLNGGEVAALAITEAVVRLIPGFMGNAESLVEESHEDGLLEYPVYTKPRVLARPRRPRRAALRRPRAGSPAGATSRPCSAPPSGAPTCWQPTSVGGDEVRPATLADAGEILTLQLACWVAEQRANPGVEIHALRETLDDVRRWLGRWTVIVRRRGGRLIAAARGRVERHGDHAGAWDVGRLMVAPDLQGQGLGRDMLERIEAAAPAGVSTYVLFTGAGSVDNLRMYKKAGYRLRGAAPGEPGAVVLTKKRRSPS